jgi:hypothetical protein
MRRTLQIVTLLVFCLFLTPAAAFAVTPVNVYRFYSPGTGTHFYTASDVEMVQVRQTLSSVMSYDGVAYTVDSASPAATQGLYRFYNVRSGNHFYTASDAERDAVMSGLSSVYRYEGVAYMVSSTPVAGAVPVYRFYNVRGDGAYFYTASASERDSVMATLGSTFRYEGIAYYVPTAPQAPVTVVPPAATGDLAVAQADLSRYIQTYPLLQGCTVQMGDARGYQAITYFTTGLTVISASHTASIGTIMAHEIWHDIDWRDNSVIDWGENVPPANAASYVGRTR